METRLKILVKWIEFCFRTVPKNQLTPVMYKKLFYDNFDINNNLFEIIDDTKL